jgi:hypothetical protein
MRPTGIFASNVKQCLTKTTAYEKGTHMMPAGTSGQKTNKFFTNKTNRPRWTKLSKQTIQFFKTI